jgi:hypothetical protein
VYSFKGDVHYYPLRRSANLSCRAPTGFTAALAIGCRPG